MYSESDIDGAVEAGALSAREAAAFRDFVARSRSTDIVDEEHFRLLTGFNDIFVSIAAVLMLVAVGWIGNAIRIGAPEGGPSPAAGLLVAATAWGLAEYFTRERRMALPSILLLLAFAGGTFVGLGTLLGGRIDPEHSRSGALLLSGVAAVTGGAVWLHWRRFHVPITVAAGAATVAGLALLLALAAFPAIGDRITIVILLCGFGVFGLAMKWDISDPARQTRRSDVAFWLHLLAAPMIVHPIFSLLGMLHGSADPVRAGLVVLLYLIIGLIALAIDRRALMVSALAYVLYAISSLIEQAGAVDLAFGITALIIGSALLLLSAFWHVARRFVVAQLPDLMRNWLPQVDRPVPTRA
jgi:hypothetical protein